MSKEKLTRKQLYDLVWSKPLTKLAKEYAISDTGLRKICKKHNIPLPKLGHWQKLQYGKKVVIIALPKIKDDTSLIELSIRKEGEENSNSYLSDYHKLKKEIENDKTLKTTVPDKISKYDPLITLARKDLQNKEPSNWRNSKGLIISSSDVLNIEVSKSNVKRALKFLDTLIKLLKKRGHEIKIDNGKTYAIINNEELELRCRETIKRVKIERNSWESYDYTPSGRLTLRLENNYPNKEWKDGNKRKLEDQLPNILTSLELRSKKIKKERIEREEAQKQYEIERQKKELLKQKIDNELESFKKLYFATELHHKANVMRNYINKVKEKAIQKNDLTVQLTEWIDWASKKADWVDPLTDYNEDELLGEFEDKYFEKEKPKYSWYS
ncbi:hypothetical protein U8527_03435 [Kordia algicida OT-1]|uniref:Uncharacterized protein n=1 Tax=Kordia algicida OT-1 TaxID=391587 RepID=A9DP77_9FLAO|nr:hypothetical protein [Kordia algicida]EDP97372.1 hypothetical protein KAOT1_19457 [Kordia algicida OT-1]